MDAKYRMLGQRIVEAARLAAAVHVHSSLEQFPLYRRQVMTGGAGSVGVEGPCDPSHLDGLFTDDVPPTALGRSHRSRLTPWFDADDGGADQR
jgi:hypothetical protein